MKKFDSPKVIMITGAAGYIGSMLCDQFSKSPDIEQIIAVDRLSTPLLLKDNKKIIWITANLYQNVWKIPALINRPEVIIHCAWQAGGMYDGGGLKRKLNIESSRAVFDFALKNQFVKKLIFLSDISVYGARLENSQMRLFNEDDEPDGRGTLLGSEKSETEAILRSLFTESHQIKKVFVLRLPTVIGPMGIGIASAEHSDMFCGKILKQFVHEDDVIDVIAMFAFSRIKDRRSYEVYNFSPNDLVPIDDVGRRFKKNFFILPPVFIKAIFFLLYHLSRGRLTRDPLDWRLFCHTIPVDGSKITINYDFDYTFTSHEALISSEGRYGNSDK